MCNNNHRMNFHYDLCETVNKEENIIIIRHRIVDNCYAINPNFKTPLMCSRIKLDLTELWHRKLSHINYKDLVHLVIVKKVRGNLRLSGESKPICGECVKGKQTKSSHKKVKEIRTMQIESISGKRYVLVVVDDFSRYSFVSFLRGKLEAIKHLKSLFNRMQVEISHPIVRTRSDRGSKFDNVDIDLFYELKGIKHEFSAPITQ